MQQRRLKEIQIPTGIEPVPYRLIFGLNVGSGAHFQGLLFPMEEPDNDLYQMKFISF